MPLEFVEAPGSAKFKEQKYIQSLKEKVIDLEEIIAELEEVTDEAESKKVVERHAYIETINALLSSMSATITAGVAEACYEAEEFNYRPYINHLLSAVDANKDIILTIVPLKNYSDFTVNLDLSPLGTVDEWFGIVQQARDDKGWGKTRGIPFTNPHGLDDAVEREDLAVRMWREKIYKPGREGGKVIKYYTEKKKKKDGTISKTQKTKDVTAKYKGKYQETVDYRLSLLPKDRAPFWELIEYGNADSGEEGAYPTSNPAHMISKIETSIKRILKATYKDYLEKAEEALTTMFHEEYNIKRIGKSYKDLPENVKKAIEEELKQPDQVVRITKGGEKILKLFRDDEFIFYPRITKGGKVYLSKKSIATSRWVK